MKLRVQDCTLWSSGLVRNTIQVQHLLSWSPESEKHFGFCYHISIHTQMSYRTLVIERLLLHTCKCTSSSEMANNQLMNKTSSRANEHPRWAVMGSSRNDICTVVLCQISTSSFLIGGSYMSIIYIAQRWQHQWQIPFA